MRTSASGRRIALLLWVLLGGLVLLLSSLWYFRWDLTADKGFSLSPLSLQLVEAVEEPLHITYYVSPELEDLYPHARNIKDFLQLYSSASRQVQVEVRDPVKEGLENSLLQQGVFGHQIHTTKGNSTQLVTVYSSIVLEYLNQVAVVPFAQTAESLEYELASRLLMLVEETGAWPVLLMAGNGLSVQDDYGDVVPWLEAAGFLPTVVTAEEFPLMEERLTQGEGLRIPLMLFGSSSLTGGQVDAIRRFVEAGGRLLAMTSAHTADLYDDWDVVPAQDKLLPVLASWGLELGAELVLDISCFRATFLSQEDNPVYEQVNYPLWIQALPQYTVEHPVSRRAFNLEFYWSSPITLMRLDAQPLVYTTPAAWLLPPELDREQPFVTNPFMVSQTASQAGQVASQYVLSALAPVEGGGQVLLIGSQYFLSTLLRQYTGSLGNLDFATKGLLLLCGQDSLLELKNKASVTKGLHKMDQAQLEASRPRVLAVNLVLLPLSPALIALVVLLMRRAGGRSSVRFPATGGRDD